MNLCSNKSLTFMASLITAVLFLPGVASAHERNYVFTEQYRTIPQGQFEIEQWTKFKVPDRDVTNANEWEYQTELEYGITDRWTIAHYQFWQTENVPGPGDDTRYGGFKFETKYRIGEKGQYWLDPLIYLEWETEPYEDNPNTIEAKIVLSKDLGDFNFTYNQILESKLGSGGRTTPEFAFAANYRLPADLHIGVEFIGNYWAPGSHRNELSLGPVLSWANQYFWITGGVAFGVNHAADDIQARIITGVPF